MPRTYATYEPKTSTRVHEYDTLAPSLSGTTDAARGGASHWIWALVDRSKSWWSGLAPCLPLTVWFDTANKGYDEEVLAKRTPGAGEQGLLLALPPLGENFYPVIQVGLEPGSASLPGIINLRVTLRDRPVNPGCTALDFARP